MIIFWNMLKQFLWANLHTHRDSDDFQGEDNMWYLNSQTSSYLEVSGKILSGISEDKIRQAANALENCILQNLHLWQL